MRNSRLPYEKRRLLAGPDPHGFELENHPSNQRTVLAAQRHEERTRHLTMRLYIDTPDGDVCDGFCCYACDWQREFAFQGKRRKSHQ